MNESVGTVAEQSLVIKPCAVILPIVSICRIAFFILSISSVRQKKVNNVFVHHKCECTGWCYSKKKQKQQLSNIRYTEKSTMNVFTKITVSGFLLQRFFAGFPKFEKKNRKPLKLTLTHKYLR